MEFSSSDGNRNVKTAGSTPGDDHVNCMICADLVTDAHRATCCNSLYCLECIHKWIERGTDAPNTNTCPNCRAVITEANLRPDEVYDLMSAQMIRNCPNKEQCKCTFTGDRAAVDAHKGPCLEKYHEQSLSAIFKPLKSKGEVDRKVATKALLAMIKLDPTIQKTVARCGGVDDLIAILRTGPEDAQHSAILCFDLLAKDESIKATMMAGGVANVLVDIISSTNLSILPNAMLLMSKCVIFNRTNQDIFAALGAIPVLVGHLHSTVVDIQTNAAGTLWNLAGKNRENQIDMAELGAFPPLINLVVRRIETINAAGALWNIIAVSDPVESIKITDVQVIRCLMKELREGAQECKEWVVGCLDTLTSSNSANTPIIVEAGAIPPLLAMLDRRNRNEFVLHQTMAVISRIAEQSADIRELLRDNACTPIMVELLTRQLQADDVTMIKENATHVLHQLCKDSPETQKLFLDSAGLSMLCELSNSTSVSTSCRDRAMSMLSFILVQNKEAQTELASNRIEQAQIVTALNCPDIGECVIKECIDALNLVCKTHTSARNGLVTAGIVTVTVRRLQQQQQQQQQEEAEGQYDTAEVMPTSCAQLLCTIAGTKEGRKAIRDAGVSSSRSIGYDGAGAW